MPARGDDPEDDGHAGRPDGIRPPRAAQGRLGRRHLRLRSGPGHRQGDLQGAGRLSGGDPPGHRQRPARRRRRASTPGGCRAGC